MDNTNGKAIWMLYVYGVEEGTIYRRKRTEDTLLELRRYYTDAENIVIYVDSTAFI